MRETGALHRVRQDHHGQAIGVEGLVGVEVDPDAGRRCLLQAGVGLMDRVVRPVRVTPYVRSAHSDGFAQQSGGFPGRLGHAPAG